MSLVYTLVVEVSKTEGDDLPKEALGAAFVVFAPVKDEDEAVREVVKLFREAGLNPLEVSNYGTVEEREKQGYEFGEEEMKLVREAIDQQAIIILDKDVFFCEDEVPLN